MALACEPVDLMSQKKIDAQKIELLNKKDKIQSRFESHDNEAKLYASKRDQIADKLIDRYKEKLSPLEKELERMQTGRDQLDLLSEVAAVKHKASEARLAGLDKQKMQIEDALRRTGMSERQIKKFEGVKQLDQLLSQGREAIRVEKENFAKRRLEINSKIAKQDKKANVYRDKKSEFARVKEGKPLKIDMPRRNRRGPRNLDLHLGLELSSSGKIWEVSCPRISQPTRFS